MTTYELQRAKSDKDGSSCLQLTINNCNSVQSIQLSKGDCLALARQLVLFANSKESDGE